MKPKRKKLNAETQRKRGELLRNGEDYFAELFAGFQVGVGGCAFFERKDFIYHGL